MKDNDSKSLTIEYEKSKDYRTYAATGAYGGVSPQGEIICHFYVEHSKLPDKINVELDLKSGEYKENIQNKQLAHVREIQCSIVLRPDIAKAVADWINKNVEKVLITKSEK